MFTKNVADGIHRIQNAYVNAYLVEDGDRVAIIDAGLPAMWAELQSALSEIGARPGRVSHMVLTHAHFDHLGVAAKVQSEYGVPVLVHRSDAYIATHPYRYKHEKPRFLYPVRYPKAVPVLFAMTKAGALKVKGLEDMRYLDTGPADYLPGNPEIIHTPGHTAGHVVRTPACTNTARSAPTPAAAPRRHATNSSHPSAEPPAKRPPSSPCESRCFGSL
ncbi:MBL fold metallo-hydrolase [Arthrobacter sp. H14]|uniref:MBL fold metallo-hydrolase n=1 Tax=Arthrobacter sp. H14 TaxID=1312959 RepID=UPI0004B41879